MTDPDVITLNHNINWQNGHWSFPVLDSVLSGWYRKPVKASVFYFFISIAGY